MVFLVLTREGCHAIADVAENERNSIWVNAGVLSDTELEKLRMDGIDIMNFTVHIDPTDVDQIRKHIHMVSLHNAGEKLWVEF